MDINTIKNIFEDKEFVKKLLEQKTDESFMDVLDEKGVEVSLEEAEKIREELPRVMSEGSKLTEEDIDNVGGGTTVGTFLKVAAIIVGAGFAFDVVGNVRNRDTAMGRLNAGLNRNGSGTAYERAVTATGDLVLGVGNRLMGVVGGANQEGKEKHKGLESMIPGGVNDKEDEGEEIVRGFGIENGKLF